MTTRGPSQSGASGQPTAASRTTRARTRQAASSPQTDTLSSPGDIARKRPQTAGEQARQALSDAKCLDGNEHVAPRTFYKIFNLILRKFGDGMHSETRLVLQAFATLLQEGETYEHISNKMMDAIARRVETKLETVLNNDIHKMSGMVDGIVANQKEMQGAAAALAGKTEDLQKLAQEVGSSARNTIASSDQLSNTVTLYKDALLTAGKAAAGAAAKQRHQSSDSSEYPRLTRDLDRKSQQLLVELGKETMDSKSTTELRENIDAVLRDLTPAPPEGAKVQEINKLRNGGVIVQLSSKEAAEWLTEPSNKRAFMSKLDNNLKAFTKDRAYPIPVPRIPTTFDPSNQEHLREIEGANGLEPNIISKARWIKPIYRRHTKQKVACTTLSLPSTSEANRLIRDGMYICSSRTYPKRLKYEPKQCMKCQKWGHFPLECQATTDTCRTCGGNNTTKDCTEQEIRYSVACRSNEHASWDRDCPDSVVCNPNCCNLNTTTSTCLCKILRFSTLTTATTTIQPWTTWTTTLRKAQGN